MQLRTLLAVACCAVSGPVLADAPFCVVSGAGTSCHYWDAVTCRQAAASTNGMCVANQQAQQPRTPSYGPNFGESFRRGYDDAARQRREAEEHQARMRLYEAQTRAATQVAESIPTELRSSGLIVYRCVGSGGDIFYTGTPAVGCVVVALP